MKYFSFILHLSASPFFCVLFPLLLDPNVYVLSCVNLCRIVFILSLNQAAQWQIFETGVVYNNMLSNKHSLMTIRAYREQLSHTRVCLCVCLEAWTCGIVKALILWCYCRKMYVRVCVEVTIGLNTVIWGFSLTAGIWVTFARCNEIKCTGKCARTHEW